MCKKCSLVGFAVAVLILGLTAAYANEGVVRTGFNDETVHLQKLPSLVKISALSTKSPQPDTLLYDNNAPYYIETAWNTWTAVRFTPTAPFTLMAIYFAVWNQYNNTIDGCSLFVVPDNGSGLPDWLNRIYVGYVSPTLPHTTWIQFDLAGPMYFDAYEDFHIVYGSAPGGPYPGVGWWPTFDSDGTTTQRTRVSYNNGLTWPTVTNADAFIRAGGWYEIPTYSDTICYDDGNPMDIDINQNALFAVRFTPVPPFNLMAVYFMLRNDYNTADRCSIWVTEDNGGVPA